MQRVVGTTTGCALRSSRGKSRAKGKPASGKRGRGESSNDLSTKESLHPGRLGLNLLHGKGWGVPAQKARKQICRNVKSANCKGIGREASEIHENGYPNREECFSGKKKPI